MNNKFVNILGIIIGIVGLTIGGMSIYSNVFIGKDVNNIENDLENKNDNDEEDKVETPEWVNYIIKNLDKASVLYHDETGHEKEISLSEDDLEEIFMDIISETNEVKLSYLGGKGGNDNDIFIDYSVSDEKYRVALIGEEDIQLWLTDIDSELSDLLQQEKYTIDDTNNKKEDNNVEVWSFIGSNNSVALEKINGYKNK